MPHPFVDWGMDSGQWTSILETAKRWAEKHPQLSSRIGRAIPLVLTVTKSKENTYIVGSSSDKDVIYVVHVDPVNRRSTCDCQDSVSGHHCKHRLATALYVVAHKRRPGV